ncbi:hypothetical protein [Paracoccus sp. KR1-242]|uniref:hypothetical protein n=1 Tax=Paracoccus sp. KR1-242 TaxID=3410028 RepID=UPI003BFCC1BB
MNLYPEMPADVRQRLDAFASQTGTTPPEHVLIDEYGDGGALTDEILNYCRATGLSLDWLWLGEGDQTVVREGRA